MPYAKYRPVKREITPVGHPVDKSVNDRSYARVITPACACNHPVSCVQLPLFKGPSPRVITPWDIYRCKPVRFTSRFFPVSITGSEWRKTGGNRLNDTTRNQFTVLTTNQTFQVQHRRHNDRPTVKNCGATAP